MEDDDQVEPLISVCIPAYNRPQTLSDLLDSVVSQDCSAFEIVVCEDGSPAQEQIKAVVARFQEAYPDKAIFFFANEKNLGYDGNLRHLLEVAHGEYCLFMGDDDLLCSGALARIGAVLERYTNLGAITRAYVATDRLTGQVLSEHRYYSGDRFFPAGVSSVGSFYRRFVTISGLVVHRARSLQLATSRFDGTLLYQLYLVANLLLDMDGYYISDMIAVRRAGGDHFFGSSEAERERFAPRTLTPQHSVNFMRGALNIAAYVEETRNVKIHERILKDFAAYAYPFLCLHSQNKRIFWHYARDLAQIGFGKYRMFWVYVALLMVFDSATLNRMIQLSKRFLKRTPAIGDLYEGIPVLPVTPKRGLCSS